MKKFLLLLMLSSQYLFAQKDFITPGSNLFTDGIPDIPVSLKSEVQRYSESRSAGFADWNPVKRNMLMVTRFGNVAQLHLLKMPMGARKQMTFYEDAVTDAIYEPVKGEYFLFSKDAGGNEFGQIYRYDLNNGDITLLTDGGRSQNGGITWNHKGDKIAYNSTRRNGGDRDIYIMNPKDSGSDKLLLENKGGGWAIVDWSPDDKKLLIGEYISVNESHYWLADVSSGTKIPLGDTAEKNVSYGQAKFAKDGKGIYFLTDKDNEFHRLAYMELSSGKITYLTTIPWSVESFDMSKDGKHILFITNEAGESKLYHLTTANKAFKKINGLPAGVYSEPTIHANNMDVAISINSARSAADIYVVNILNGKVERWTESEMGGMVASNLVEPKLFKWKSFDNLEISGFYYPAPKKFTGKRPVMINIHGGPEGQSRPGFMGSSNYYLNEMGIAMIFPNVRGSSGYGKTYLTLDNGMKREESVKDIGTLLDWIEKQPELDAQKVMVIGGSYGGYMSLAVSTNYSDRIKCGVDVVGISNFNTFLKNTETYRRDLRRVEYGDERVPEMHAFLEKISPLTNASKIKKPLFIVQGGNDPRVPRMEAEQMANKIRMNGGIVWYLEAKDEGHGFRKKTNSDFQRFATISFIKQYLL